MEKKGTPKVDIILGLLLALSSIAGFVESVRIPRLGEIYSAPGLFPMVLSASILVMSLGLAYSGWKRGGLVKEKADNNCEEKSVYQAQETRRLFVVIGIILFYIAVLFGRVSYPIATFVFLVAIMVAFRATQWYKILAISALTSLAVTYAFTKVFFIPLP